MTQSWSTADDPTDQPAPAPAPAPVIDDAGPKILCVGWPTDLLVCPVPGRDHPYKITADGTVVDAEHVEVVLAAATSCHVVLHERRA